MTDNTQPEALRLADWLDGCGGLTSKSAAAELRRLHAENERLAALVEAQQPAPSAAAAEIEALRALSVTNIMIDVVPGDDGMGHEVYAKSVDDVVNKLSTMGAELEDWQLGIRQYRSSPTPQADSQPAPVVDYPPLPDLISSVWPFIHTNAAADSAAMVAKTSDQVDAAIHDLLRAYVDADRAARAPADSVTAPAERDEFVKLLAECRSVFPIPAPGDPLEVHWKAAMADPAEVPGYLQEIAASRAQAADSVLEDAARWRALESTVVEITGSDDWMSIELCAGAAPEPFLKRLLADKIAVVAARKQGGAT